MQRCILIPMEDQGIAELIATNRPRIFIPPVASLNDPQLITGSTISVPGGWMREAQSEFADASIYD